ncbi:uncharacterized protein TM35_000012620, partial [Trypanosoma theileri]
MLLCPLIPFLDTQVETRMPSKIAPRLRSMPLLLFSVVLTIVMLIYTIFWYGGASSPHLLEEIVSPVQERLTPALDNSDYNLNYSAYLPETLSTIVKSRTESWRADSLSMMLQPREYRRMTCAQLRTQHQREISIAAGHNKHSKRPLRDRRGILLADPYPVCGRYLLSRLTGGKHRYVFVVRTGRSQPSQLPSVLTVRAGDW